MSQIFAALGLSADLVRAVAEAGYAEPTPIQTAAIPAILAGRDVLAGAQTGTGKTAAFALPLLQRLATPSRERRSGSRAVRALILTPTRELAVQVADSFRTYGRHSGLASAAVYGGVSFRPQAQALRRGVAIVVATPGRLLDHLAQRTLDLRAVETLVLDEADRMLDMGFIHDIRRIIAALPVRRQNLLFSATFSDTIRKLANGLLHDPVRIELARDAAGAERITQRFHPIDTGRKRELLTHLVASGNWRQVLVFTRTKRGANRLAEQLAADGIEATAIHGNKSQGARTQALSRFKTGRVRVLVATDVAARGLDIAALPRVVNYELPNVAEDYVHRIGRTGRAGLDGEAVSLVSGDEHGHLAAIERLLGRSFEREVVAGFAPSAWRPAVAPQATPGGRGRRRDAPPLPSARARRANGVHRPRSEAWKSL